MPAPVPARPPLPAAPRRLRCDRCQRPASTCLCHWVRATANEVEVLVLQHPLEVAQAKGSARLLQLSLQRSRCEVGECFDDAALGGWLAAGAGATWLLYPDTTLAPARPGSEAPAVAAPPARLVVLDATWRKSLRMLCLNPCLQALPRLALRDRPASRYARLRRAARSDQLSTLEATCLALQQLEPAAGSRYAPLLEAFDGFVAEQLARVPPVSRPTGG